MSSSVSAATRTRARISGRINGIAESATMAVDALGDDDLRTGVQRMGALLAEAR